MTIGEKVTAARRALGKEWTQAKLTQELARHGLKVSRGWVGNLETDRIKRFEPHELKALSAALGKPVEYFADDPSALPRFERETITAEWVYLSIMGVVPAGAPTEAIEDYQGKYPVPREVVVGDPANYAMARANGESMIELGILNGDMLAYRKQEDANDGDVVIALVDGGITCKKLRRKGGKCYLEGANSKMAPPPARPFRVIGKVVWRGGNPWR